MRTRARVATTLNGIRLALILVALVAAVVASRGRARAQGSAFDLDPDTRVLAPVQYKHVTIFPVVHRPQAAVDRTGYMTLAEGMKRKTVAVAENRQRAQVNQVSVANNSDQPLLLLGGEIILGGQQDRIIGKDTLIPPHTEAAVEVYCVEHGRWSGRREFTAGGALVANKVRGRAKFRSDQGQVWAQVAKENAAHGAQNPTDSYRKVATGAEGQRATKAYREHFAAALARLPEGKKLVGIIAAINGRVTSVDVFANPALFAAYRERLLDAVALTAADVPVAAAAPPATAADVRRFVDEAESGQEREVTSQRGNRTVEKKAKGVAKSAVMPSAPKAKPVYRSYQTME
ncbi:MAG TPA: DUF6569 family protein [Polyangia bacterium]|jgi:hypothetical protein